MSYIKINGESPHYNVSVMPFTTQHGKKAIRFIGENIPTTNKGFKLFDNNGNQIADFSLYVYEYCPNEYSLEQDEQILPQWVETPLQPDAIDKLNTKINQVNSRVDAITPYTKSKIAYINETQIIFENITKQGIMTAEVVDKNGTFIEYNITKENDNIIVSFDPLEEVATVSIIIQ